ncbi:unnamed protein product, partial [Medioppia subpectinata]
MEAKIDNQSVLVTDHDHNDHNNIDHNKNPVMYSRELVWRNIVLMSFVYMSAVYGLYLAVTAAQFKTIVFMNFIGVLSSLGVQAGCHRLWCHRTYKANVPLKIILMVMQTLAFQNDIYEWSRDHRLHHKHSDTDADPHNSGRGFFFSHVGWLLCKKHPEVKEKGKTIDMSDIPHNSGRGFFFSHVGWLLCKKHPEVKEKGKTIDMSDIASDPIVQFQRAFYIPLLALIWAAIPTFIPHYYWGETLWNSLFVCVMLRYCYIVNLTWCINSVAHIYGMKPYDNSIKPVEAHMRHFFNGEGYHNFHHAFPWDYSASELGAIDTFNPGTAFIDMFAAIGWAYDLKKASNDMVKSRQTKSGDIHYTFKSRLSEQIVGSI